MAATKTSATKKSAAKKSATKRSATKKQPAKQTATKRSATKKQAAAKKSATKKQPAAKKSATKKQAAKQTATKRSATKKQPAAKKSATKKQAAKQTATKRSATKKAPARPDAIAVLKADHRHVEELFDKFEGLGDRAHKSRESTVSKIIEELSVHAGIEETVFYPAVRDRFASADEPMVLEALEEHHLVKLTLKDLESMSAQDERFVAKVTVLREVVDHHVEEEENELFKRVRSVFSKAELTDLGEELIAARATAPTRPHPAAPDTPPGNIVANVLVAPLDAASDLTERAADAVRDAIS